MPAAPEYSIGLDLGGTNLRAAAVARDGTMLDNVSGKTAYSAGREAIVGDMVEAIVTLRERLGAAGLAGIGVAVPGFILLEQGVIRNSNNLASLEDFPLRDEMTRRIGTQVILENDANAAALVEKWIGAGRGGGQSRAVNTRNRHRRRDRFEWKSAARLSRHGGRTGTHHGCFEWEPMRVRESWMRREACIGHGCDGDGEVAGLGRWVDRKASVRSRDGRKQNGKDDLRLRGRGAWRSARHAGEHVQFSFCIC